MMVPPIVIGFIPPPLQVSQNSFDRSEGSPMNPWVGDVFVSILPCWHIFERTAEYFTLTRGVTMV